jgi:predicted methyltransferase
LHLACRRHLRARHECGLVAGKVSREQFVKLRRVDLVKPSGVFFIAAHMPDAGEKESDDGKRFPRDLAKSGVYSSRQPMDPCPLP